MNNNNRNVDPSIPNQALPLDGTPILNPGPFVSPGQKGNAGDKGDKGQKGEPGKPAK